MQLQVEDKDTDLTCVTEAESPLGNLTTEVLDV